MSGSLLYDAFNLSQLSVSRRWAPSTNFSSGAMMKSAEGCIVACINNFAWINMQTSKPAITTGSFMTSLQDHFACLPCESPFIKQGLIGSSSETSSSSSQLHLYSIWNYTQAPMLSVVKGSTLQLMQGMYGACYTCPPNTDTIAESDVMCESQPGHGKPKGIATTVTVVTASALEVTGLPQINVPSIRSMPFIRPSNQDYFLCCGKDIPCRIFTKANLDLNQGSLGKGSYYDKCTNIANNATSSSSNSRTLLQTSTNDQKIEACYGSQYNVDRGDNTCYDCPPGF